MWFTEAQNIMLGPTGSGAIVDRVFLMHLLVWDINTLWPLFFFFPVLVFPFCLDCYHILVFVCCWSEGYDIPICCSSVAFVHQINGVWTLCVWIELGTSAATTFAEVQDPMIPLLCVGFSSFCHLDCLFAFVPTSSTMSSVRSVGIS